MGKARKNFYLSYNVIKHIEGQGNQSHYIDKLVLADMKSENLTIDKVIDLIKKHSQSGKVTPYEDLDVKDSINSLLSM